MEFTITRDFSELASLSGQWNALLSENPTNIPFLRYEYQSAWWQTHGGGEWPEAELAIVTARQDGKLIGIAPLFSSPNLDGDPALLLLGSIEVSDYLDVLVRQEHLPAFLSGLLDFVAGSDLPAWHLLDWHNLLESSPTLPVLQAEAQKRGWTFRQERSYRAPAVTLPGDFEAYLAGIDKKQRHEIRRKIRRLEESDHSLRWFIHTDPSTLDARVEDFLNLMAYDPEKAAFLTPAMRQHNHLVCRAALENGWLQLAFLEVDGKMAAGYLNFDYQDRIWVYNSGLSSDFYDLSAGWVLLGYLLRWANENGRSEFDFMRGDEGYKYKFGGVDKHLVRVTVQK